MEKNEVVKESKVEGVSVRDDLNDMVKLIKFDTVKFKRIIRHVLYVTLWNDVKIEFDDKDDLYSLFKSFTDAGVTDFISSKKLVEETKTDEEGEILGTYFCVRYELSDGSVYKVFAKKFTSNKAIENYYNLFKKTIKK